MNISATIALTDSQTLGYYGHGHGHGLFILVSLLGLKPTDSGNLPGHKVQVEGVTVPRTVTVTVT